ncbi:MAG: hypothetical protein ACYDH0_06500 [Candidatus Aminicenantales bacterium]
MRNPGHSEKNNHQAFARAIMVVLAAWLALTVRLAAETGKGIQIDGDRVRVDTPTLEAVVERGVLTSLVRKSDGRELVRSSAVDKQGVYLVYANQEAVPLGNWPKDKFTLLRINDHCVEVRIEAWDGDGILTIADDERTGDLILELGAYSSRPGVRACRWLLSGIDPELELVAPFFQGIRLPLEDPLIRNTNWNWPHRWEAGLAILQGAKGGFWVHCRDTRFKYKCLQVGTDADARCLGFDTDAYGPIDDNLSAGGLAWRVNVYDGDWKVPASVYREWWSEAYGLKDVRRPAWMNEVKLAIAWCPREPAVLDALAKRIDPRNVLLHFDKMRDQYPCLDFTPTPEGAAFVKKAAAMGFRIFLHCPALDMDPLHPAYNMIRDFQYRELENKKLIGWTWKGEGPVPESHAARLLYPGRNVNMRMHPGLSMWRSLLAENIRALVETLSVDTIFLDVSMNTHNVANCLVENTPPTEGMVKLEKTIQSLGKGLILAGEGRNEMTVPYQAFSQVHIFKSWFENIEGLERIDQNPCLLGEFLFGRWSRSFGYHSLSGKTPAEEFRIRHQINMGAIPTVTIRTADEILNPNPTVHQILDSAVR